VDFQRRRPSPGTLAWAERALGPGFRVVATRRMTGGISSTVHRLTAERDGRRVFVVLRQYEYVAPGFTEPAGPEADILRGVRAAGLAAPELIAFSPQGGDADGHSSVLMTRLAGHVYLTPDDPGRWLGQIADTAAAIHDAPVSAGPFKSWTDPARLVPPTSARRPELWRAAIRALQEERPPVPTCFIHRDYQHFNLLWARGRLTGVVDWGTACTGPPEIDVGHCRLNLAVLFSAEWAERFRLGYEARTGHRTDPWWDLHALASYDDKWRRFIPIQADGSISVDTDGMTARVEELLQGALRRL
jgi:aminoglycoside phosphotransferase (APT) family kinase protein